MMKPSEILELRKRLGLSQPQMAEKLGVCEMSISNWENGRRVPFKVFMQRLEELRDEQPTEEVMQDD